MIRDRITQLVTYLSRQIRVSVGGVVLGRETGAGSAQELTLDGLSITAGVLTVVGKQATLVSGTNIKTINGASLLGSGNISTDLTSGPVTSSGGVSAIADGALSIGKVSGLQTILNGSTGGNGAADAGKLVKFKSDGSVECYSADGNSLYGVTDSGQAVYGSASSGTGVLAGSDSGTGLEASVDSGMYHAKFGYQGNDKSAIERVRGWFVWFYSTFTGRLKTADITANRDWTLPDASGTVALTSDINNTNVVAAIDEDPAAVREALRNSYLIGTPAPLQCLKRTLDAGYGASFAVLSDSTGDGDGTTGDLNPRWVYALAQKLAATYPNHRVLYKSWNTATQAFRAQQQVSAGVGGDLHIHFLSNASFSSQLPPEAKNTTWANSDFELQVEASFPASRLTAGWPTSTYRLIAWNNTGSGGRGWLEVKNDGTIEFRWSEDASGTTLRTGAVSMSAQLPSGFTADAKYRFKVTLDIVNGAGTSYDLKFWYSTNSGTSWTQFGSTVSPGVTTTVFDPQSAIGIGHSPSNPVAGELKIYYAQVFKGIDGQPIYPDRIDAWRRRTAAESPLVGAPVLYITNVACSGYGLVSFLTTLLPYHGKAFANNENQFWFISSSHNDAGMNHTEWQQYADQVITAVKSYAPSDPAFVMLNQNPQEVGQSNEGIQRIRGSIIAQYAAARNHLCIDVMKAFDDYSGPLSDIVAGIHPNGAGSQLWADLIHESITSY